MAKKLTAKQLDKWLNTLPATTPVWALVSDPEITLQQVDAVLKRYDAFNKAASDFYEELRNIDSLLTAYAENDALENMQLDLRDERLLGYYVHYHHHLINAAACHWESSGRDLNAEIGRNVY
jgi:hypothetical protein